MAGRVAGKIKLQTVDELLGVPEIAGTQEIELGRIHAFPNHPFKVLDDERMDMLVESIFSPSYEGMHKYQGEWHIKSGNCETR